MMNCRIVFLIIATIAGIYVGFLIQKPVSSLCDSMECPYCYGDDLCGDIEEKRINLRYKSFHDTFYNLLSVKNVYFGDYEGVPVVLKKLGHQGELNQIARTTPISRDVILNFLNTIESGSVKSLKICDHEVSVLLVDSLRKNFSLEQLWTILQANAEPLILSIFKAEDDWPVPHLHGACGSLIVEEHCGHPLNHFQTASWYNRAFLALQLLEAAINFTRNHKKLRLYLTDISPDNIAVDDDFNLYFVDLENVILKQKLTDDVSVHYSEYYHEDDFVYDEDAVCKSSISDHNVYAVCKLLLSKRAPWPMMQNGLLHSPPHDVVFQFNELFALIEECVDSKEKLSRFYIAEELIKLLNQVTQ